LKPHFLDLSKSKIYVLISVVIDTIIEKIPKIIKNTTAIKRDTSYPVLGRPIQIIARIIVITQDIHRMILYFFMNFTQKNQDVI